MPSNYLVEDDFEGSESDDDDYVDVDQEMNPDDSYSWAVEQHDDEEYHEGEDHGNLHRKSSASSLSTTGASTATSHLRKKNNGESARPANLPVVASPFGLFGNLALRNPRSRAGSAEVEEDKGSGIANANFFKPSVSGFFSIVVSLTNLPLSLASAPDALVRQLNTVQHQAPHILTRGIVTPTEAEKLFQMYVPSLVGFLSNKYSYIRKQLFRLNEPFSVSS